MAFESSTTPHLMNVALKEYEALRKEIEARTDKTKTYGWPVILVAVGAAAGYKPDLLNLNLALMFVPAFAMIIAAFAANANHDRDKVRKALALTEDRIFILSDHPLLCDHSSKVLNWKQKARRRFIVAAVAAAAYLATIIGLGLNLIPDIKGIDGSGIFLLYGVLLAPMIFFFYNSVKSYKLHGDPFRTLLLDHIKRATQSPPGGGRLVYSTYGEPGGAPWRLKNDSTEPARVEGGADRAKLPRDRAAAH